MSSIYQPNLPYCVYLTTYFGNKLPMFYLGSSSVKKVQNGYKGSVSSKKYKQIWKEELKQNPQLFKTQIISYYTTRIEATEKENQFQLKLNVVKSPLYMNTSNAIPNGIYGVSMKGENNPMFGKTRSMATETKIKISQTKKGVVKSEQTKQKMRKPKPIGFSEKLKGNQNAKGAKSWLGKTHSEETKKKISDKIKELNRLKNQGLSQSGTLIK